MMGVLRRFDAAADVHCLCNQALTLPTLLTLHVTLKCAPSQGVCW